MDRHRTSARPGAGVGIRHRLPRCAAGEDDQRLSARRCRVDDWRRRHGRRVPRHALAARAFACRNSLRRRRHRASPPRRPVATLALWVSRAATPGCPIVALRRGPGRAPLLPWALFGTLARRRCAHPVAAVCWPGSRFASPALCRVATRPLFPWDAWTQWATKARVWYELGRIAPSNAPTYGSPQAAAPISMPDATLSRALSH